MGATHLVLRHAFARRRPDAQVADRQAAGPIGLACWPRCAARLPWWAPVLMLGPFSRRRAEMGRFKVRSIEKLALRCLACPGVCLSVCVSSCGRADKGAKVRVQGGSPWAPVRPRSALLGTGLDGAGPARSTPSTDEVQWEWAVPIAAMVLCLLGRAGRSVREFCLGRGLQLCPGSVPSPRTVQRGKMEAPRSINSHSAPSAPHPLRSGVPARPAAPAPIQPASAAASPNPQRSVIHHVHEMVPAHPSSSDLEQDMEEEEVWARATAIQSPAGQWPRPHVPLPGS